MRYGIVVNGELYHHGILGQKWGIRRFQNKNGKLTSAGKKRKRFSLNPFRKKSKETDEDDFFKVRVVDGKKVMKVHKDYANAHDKRPMSQLSNAELKAKIERMILEKKYNELKPKEISAGRKFLNNSINLAKDYQSVVNTVETFMKTTDKVGDILGFKVLEQKK